MSDNNTPSTVEQSNIHPVQITDELKTCFINYAMSVIVDRALPNVYDGLKPVQRRSIYGMYEQKIFYGTKTVKSAKVVGDEWVDFTRMVTLLFMKLLFVWHSLFLYVTH